MIKKKRNNGLRKLCGHARRTWGTCECSWHFSFQWRGEKNHVRFAFDKKYGRHIEKDEAEDLAADLRKQIKAGTYGKPAPLADMTMQQLIDAYIERYVMVERKSTADDFRDGLGVVGRTVLPSPTGGKTALGMWRVLDVTTDSIERFREARRAAGTGPGGTNRLLSRLRGVFNWGIRVGYLEATPFARHGQAVVKMTREIPRSRRLDADTDEEARLLAACDPHLRSVVEAAIQSGMRRGEILGLRWADVSGLTIVESKDRPGHHECQWAGRAEIVLSAASTKTRRERRIPISSRLRSILEMRRFDPKGEAHEATAYVFGNALGQKVDSTKRAWQTAVLRAYGEPIVRTPTMNLAPECRATLKRVNLHFHDLRRECGSRWLEGGVPIHVVRDWLGHTNVSQTSTYLAGTVRTSHDAMTAYERLSPYTPPPADGDGDGACKKLASTRQSDGGRPRQTAAVRTKGNKKPQQNAISRDQRVM
jgi:integrase